MGKRILIRGGKDPFHAFSHEKVLNKNILGTNSGNLIFAESVWKTLLTEGTTITSNGYSANASLADEINEKYDYFVLPFANAFRSSFIKNLNKFTDLIEKLRIPVIVIGIGAQDSLSLDGSKMSPFSEDVKRFVKAVLNKSSSLGVRGEYTYNYLRSLGFSDSEVDVIGCPSMYYFGETLPVPTKKSELLDSDLVSMNVSPYVKGIGDIFENNFKKYSRLTYVPQNNESLDQMLWGGINVPKQKKVFPKSAYHPAFLEDRVRFFIDPKTWMNHLRDYDFVFGTRIHGNVMGVLSGVPSFVMAHDSRTLELAEFFQIPHKKMVDIPKEVVASDLFNEANYGPMIDGHKDRFEGYLSFLNKNGLPHTYEENQDRGESFDLKMKNSQFPQDVSSFSSLKWLNHELSDLKDNSEQLRREVVDLRKAVSKVSSTQDLKSSLKQVKSKNIMMRIKRKIKRKVKKVLGR